MLPFKPKSLDDYLMAFDEPIQMRLLEIRNAILQKFPKTEESIRYNMPAYKLNGIHVYFSACKKHIGMYPLYVNSDIESELKEYRGKNTKDTLHFLHNRPLPIELILRLVDCKFNKKIG